MKKDGREAKKVWKDAVIVEEDGWNPMLVCMCGFGGLCLGSSSVPIPVFTFQLRQLVTIYL